MSDFNKTIDSLEKNQLKELLWELKLYRDLKKQLWNRWKTLYNKIRTWNHSYYVEYYSAVWEDLAFDIASKIYKQVFEIDLNKEDIDFIKKESVLWWIKVYVDDKVVDLSYQKIEKMITG